jgi:uncharacterized protein (DUF488 family)
VRVATIGVYGFTAGSFGEALREAGVDLVVDVRQRRGVRGSEYAWANAQRLPALLGQAAIGYLHRPDLAPTTELRRLQYAEDDRRGEGKRSRTALAPAYVSGYLEQILSDVDLGELAADLGVHALPALLCVERDPEACHRSLIAEGLARDHGASIAHLRPNSTTEMRNDA